MLYRCAKEQPAHNSSSLDQLNRSKERFVFLAPVNLGHLKIWEKKWDFLNEEKKKMCVNHGLVLPYSSELSVRFVWIFFVPTSLLHAWANKKKLRLESHTQSLSHVSSFSLLH